MFFIATILMLLGCDTSSTPPQQDIAQDYTQQSGQSTSSGNSARSDQTFSTSVTIPGKATLPTQKRFDEREAKVDEEYLHLIAEAKRNAPDDKQNLAGIYFAYGEKLDNLAGDAARNYKMGMQNAAQYQAKACVNFSSAFQLSPDNAQYARNMAWCQMNAFNADTLWNEGSKGKLLQIRKQYWLAHTLEPEAFEFSKRWAIKLIANASKNSIPHDEALALLDDSEKILSKLLVDAQEVDHSQKIWFRELLGTTYVGKAFRARTLEQAKENLALARNTFKTAIAQGGGPYDWYSSLDPAHNTARNDAILSIMRQEYITAMRETVVATDFKLIMNELCLVLIEETKEMKASPERTALLEEAKGYCERAQRSTTPLDRKGMKKALQEIKEMENRPL